VVPVPALLHGYLGFHRIGPIAYFRGLERAVRARGIEALFPALPPVGTIAERAQVLAKALLGRREAAFALIAHSMGGLDARFLISNLDPDKRIKSLTTVATPHLGTALARWFLESRSPLAASFRRIGSPGLRELTPESRAADPIPDRPGVVYRSYAGCRPRAELPWLVRLTADEIPGDSDGVVPVESARWGKFGGILRTDHLEAVGWSLSWPDSTSARPFEHLRFFERAVREAMATSSETPA
jgi:triacylglycerol lipase